MPDLLSVRISSRGLTWNHCGVQQYQRKPSPRRRDRVRVTDVRALHILPIPSFRRCTYRAVRATSGSTGAIRYQVACSDALPKAEDSLCALKYRPLRGTLFDDEYAGINRRSCIYFLSQSQHICGIIIPLCPPLIHHLPNSHSPIGPVLRTIDGIGLHAHTPKGARTH